MRALFSSIFMTMLLASVGQVSGQDAHVPIQAILARLAPGRKIPGDLIITGQFTDPSGVNQPFRITTKGSDQALYETGTGPSVKTTTTSKGYGWNVIGGKFTPLQPFTAMQRPIFVPFLDLLAEADNPNLQATDRGTFLVGNLATHLYTLRLPDPAPSTHVVGRPLDEETDFYVDPATSLIVRSTRFRMAENSMNVRVQLVTDFADYRNVQGFLIPFRIVETSSFGTRRPGQSIYVIQNVTVNSGVPDSTFASPGAKK
jgi:hypothetical protein